jgi:hypothetical protein
MNVRKVMALPRAKKKEETIPYGIRIRSIRSIYIVGQTERRRGGGERRKTHQGVYHKQLKRWGGVLVYLTT